LIAKKGDHTSSSVSSKAADIFILQRLNVFIIMLGLC
jgi:hypothetical protein